MTVAAASLTRLAYVPEVTPGTTPATPTFQVLRYLSCDPKPGKQVDVPDEIRADGNVASIVAVGMSPALTIRGDLSYGTYDALLEDGLRGAFSTNVLVNGITETAFTAELTYEQGATDSFVRIAGCHVNTIDIVAEAKKSVTIDFGIMGMSAPSAANAIITGATYTAATTTPVMNAANDVSALTITGVTNAPKVQKLAMKIDSGVFANNIVGQQAPYSLGMGIIKVTGSITTLFENIDTYNAILAHTDIAISTTVGATAGSRYTILLPKVKLMDGGPVVGGNGQSVILDVPFQAYYDATTGGSIKVTRAV
jgi:hypothetical protein